MRPKLVAKGANIPCPVAAAAVRTAAARGFSSYFTFGASSSWKVKVRSI